MFRALLYLTSLIGLTLFFVTPAVALILENTGNQTPPADSALTKVLIGIAAGVVGAVITAVASVVTARQRIKEVEITYQQKLHENYLANARQYTREVYVPLSITLEDLRVAYEDFRRSMKLCTADTAKEGVGADQERFLKAIDEYETAVGNLLARGADAFLTTALDENFRSFNSFLYACRAAREPVYRKNLQYSLRTGIFGFFMPRFSRRVSVEGTWSLGQNVNVDWFLGSFSY